MCVHCVLRWEGLGRAVSLHGGLGGKQGFPSEKKKKFLAPEGDTAEG